MAFKIISSAFSQGESIPKKYTCDGDNISPPLQWHGAPSDTRSFALIFDDPDAPRGTWDHWILFNIPADIQKFEENIESLPQGTRTGKNSWGKGNYGGPCPPDKMHRYFFKLYALDILLDLAPGSDKKTIEAAMKGHILAQTELMGTYDRS